ncbi:hypothetical protein GBAR_LOCUS13557 [Geodia barretti]|uniref:Uncharacterized protein n=1 Tax=Geodia barretti TaxID=519541 RepID=A0AA35WQY8_GEOBA|nr:hypothetical protein GBAR_LOCUS13557 [Geodia barretti]
MGLLHLSLLLLILSSQSLVQPLRVYIDGAEGNDSLECLNSSSIETPCQSLSFVSKNLTQKHFVVIEILGDVLNLTRAVNFTDYFNLTISGSGSSTTLHCNESDAGLAFVRVVNLSIFSFTVQNCGAPQPCNIHYHYLPVAVYVLDCSNMSIHNVDIILSNGTGLSIYNTNGVVEIMDCNFINNSVANPSTTTSGGGGLYIDFTTCLPGIHESETNCNHNSRYAISNCKFIKNSAYTNQQVKNFVPPSQQLSFPRLGKGGGLYVSFGLDATNNSFLISQCTFKSNKASVNAGGMIVEFFNSVTHNNVTVVETDFVENTCTQNQFSSGGGLLVDFMFYSQARIHGQIPLNNTFECHFSTFQGNRGSMGGGTAITVAKNGNVSFSTTISFSNCNWIENESAMGAAVFITPAIWDYTKEGYLPVPKFTDCRFESNSAIQKLEPPMAEGIGVNVKSSGHGALHISQVRVMFAGRSYFGYNSGSAIDLSSSVIDFAEESNVTFFNNTSHNGGAIAMHGSSMLQVRNSSTFLLTDNRAISRGGAIYFDFNAATYTAYYNCFISSPDFSRVNSTFIFMDNSANASVIGPANITIDSAFKEVSNNTVMVKGLSTANQGTTLTQDTGSAIAQEMGVIFAQRSALVDIVPTVRLTLGNTFMCFLIPRTYWTLTFVVQTELTGYVAARTTFHILNFSCLYSANFHCRVKVVPLAGHLTYFEGEHVPYAIAAILVFFFMIIIPPLLLVSYPLVFKLFGHCNLSETKPVTILWRMMPIQFLDTFQSSFKDKYRFFAGLYFLYRAAILALYVCCQTWLEFYSAVQLLLIAIITVHSVIQPHKERKHNIVDSLLFANLSLINAITLYYYYRTEVWGRFSSEVITNALAVTQAFLIILPLLLGITLGVIKWKLSRKKLKDYEALPSLQIDREISMEK